MWTFHQSTGEQFHSFLLAGTGYSGSPEGKNNPAMEGVEKVGPTPRGHYTMGEPFDSPHTGKFTIPLIPDDATKAYILSLGRDPDSFRCHGDSIDAPGTASEGCMILPHAVREAMWSSLDHEQEVVE